MTFTIPMPTPDNTVPGILQDHTLVYIVVGAILFYVIVVRGGKL